MPLVYDRAMAGGLADLSSGNRESKAEEDSAMLEAPAIILTITPGRSGTHYLTSLFSALCNVHAVHEPEPTMSSP